MRSPLMPFVLVTTVITIAATPPALVSAGPDCTVRSEQSLACFGVCWFSNTNSVLSPFVHVDDFIAPQTFDSSGDVGFGDLLAALSACGPCP